MSITDELREYTEKQVKWLDVSKVHYRKLFSIADRIDAEHEKAMSRAGQLLADAKKDRDCIELPKDADGEYIHIGDKLIDEDDKLQKPAIVKCILYNDEGCVVSDIDPRGCWYDPSLLRHYHAPTVEDVLREMLDAWGELPSNATNDAIVAEYASKLKLAEGVDE